MGELKDLAKKYNIPKVDQIDPKAPMLIVEDETDLRLLVVHQLNKLNYRNVAQASSGEEALELMEKTKFQFIICDYEMKGATGLEVLTEARENYKINRAPFILTMSNVSKEKLMLAVEHGVDELVSKPYAPADIAAKLTSAFKIFHNPSNPEKVYEMAKWLFRKKQFDESAKVYRELAQAAPNSARPLVGLARIQKAQQRYDQALIHLEEAEQRNENYVHVYTERAEIFVQQGKPEEALSAYRQAIYISPMNAWRYRSAADILMQAKRYPDIIELLGIALSNEVRFAELYHYLSQAHFQLADFKSSARFVRQALRFDEDNIIYLNQLGISLKELGQYDEAHRVYNQVIKLNPEDKAGLYNKAVLLATRKEFKEAIRLMEKVVAKFPEFTSAKIKLEEFKRLQGSKQAS